MQFFFRQCQLLLLLGRAVLTTFAQQIDVFGSELQLISLKAESFCKILGFDKSLQDAFVGQKPKIGDSKFEI